MVDHQKPEGQDSLGSFLEALRKQKGLEKEDLCALTKINLRVLTALENNDIHSLPPRPYVKGFVQNLCRALGGDAKKGRELLDILYNNREVALPSTSFGKSEEANRDFQEQKTYLEQKIDNLEGNETLPHGKGNRIKKKGIWKVLETFGRRKIWIPLLVIIFLIWSGAKVISIVQEYSMTLPQQNAQSELPPNSSSSAKQELSDKLLGEAKGLRKNLEEESLKRIGPSISELALPKADDLAEPEEPTQTETTSDSDELFKEVKFQPIRGPLYGLSSDSERLDPPSLLPKEYRGLVTGDQHYVYIVAEEESSWLSYKVDDQKVKRFVLDQGNTLLLKGSEIVLFMGNVNGSVVFYDNQVVETSSTTGVKSFVFPPEATKNYELPLFIQGSDGKIYSAKEVKAYLKKQSGE